ncbi:MAG TPA: thioredoxin fold domain-containing protein [Chroococcales cyanobacterium]
MHKSVLSKALFSLATFALAVAPGMCDELDWGRDLQKGLDKAKAEKKFVLADVYTDWCGPCKMLEKETFKDANFTKYLNENFVLIKANAEDGGLGQQIAENNDVHAYPTGLVFNTSGKMVKRIVGFRSAQEYEKELKKAKK